MKDLKSIFTQHFVATAATSALAIAFMTLPFLEDLRVQLSTLCGLSPTQLWLPAVTIIFGVQTLTYRRSLSIAALPLHRLVKEAEHGTQGFAFKTKAKSKEEDCLKHSIEAANLRAKEAREQADELETELEKTNLKLANASARKNELEAVHTEIEKNHRALIQQNETLKASKVALELTLENERKSKVGAEVEKRAEEIYTQMERAVTAAAYKSIWIPSLVQELKTPISIIQELSEKLTSSWTQTSITQVSEEIARIHLQSQTQLTLLNDILKRQPPTDFTRTPEPVAPLSNDAEPCIAPLAKTPEEPIPSLQPDTAANSPFDLQSILENLVTEFSPLAEGAHITYEIDPDLEIEIEDPSLLNLMHALVEAAASATESGEITIGVELRASSLSFDVACNGQLKPISDPKALAEAEHFAQALEGELEIEATSDTELHLSFEYPLNLEPTEKEVIFELED